MKRPRPYIPIPTRIVVAQRQIGYGLSLSFCRANGNTDKKYLAWLLEILCGRYDTEKMHLDHNPALILRELNKKTGKYTPDANDPDFLVYRSHEDHQIKTNVRGDGALRSDTSERMHRRRMDENRGLRKRRAKKKIPVRKKAWPEGRKIPSRKGRR